MRHQQRRVAGSVSDGRPAGSDHGHGREKTRRVSAAPRTRGWRRSRNVRQQRKPIQRAAARAVAAASRRRSPKDTDRATGPVLTGMGPPTRIHWDQDDHKRRRSGRGPRHYELRFGNRNRRPQAAAASTDRRRSNEPDCGRSTATGTAHPPHDAQRVGGIPHRVQARDAPRCRASVARAIKRIQRPRGDGGDAAPVEIRGPRGADRAPEPGRHAPAGTGGRRVETTAEGRRVLRRRAGEATNGTPGVRDRRLAARSDPARVVVRHLRRGLHMAAAGQGRARRPTAGALPELRPTERAAGSTNGRTCCHPRRSR